MFTKSNYLNEQDKALFSATAGLISTSLFPEDLLYFDIETTGLSSARSYLYMIGCMYLTPEGLILEQYFSEGPSDEINLLSEFASLLDNFRGLVHFNGRTFDVPYISAKFEHNGISSCINRIENFDLYQTLKPYKKLFGLSSMKQKAVEVFAGINRLDKYDGGELIGVYNRYLAAARLAKIRKASSLAGYTADPDSGLATLKNTDSNELLNTLLLHNYEDVYGMLKISSLLGIHDFFRHSPKVSSYGFSEDKTTFFICIQIISDILCTSDVVNVSDEPDNSDIHRMPDMLKVSDKPNNTFIHCTSDMLKVSDILKKLICNGNSGFSSVSPMQDGLIINIPVNTLTVKLYYQNPGDYYYLPSEDMAVHKSIGEFMPAELRKKATAATCYSHCNGSFILYPETHSPIKGPCFKSDYKDKYCYIDTDSLIKASTEEISELTLGYLLQITRY